ncbi:hypothetical protein [Nissabacter sp. SGAir0207]|uniref:hypothetical protein n=1 Tax=Nissabacter sp. SGAir0207 TaxID=2126321 RepID=UPI0010CD404D|nr:hypothetical protein [Nissabacter sp. SGAir0207]QCR35833.1 hypothetical protein C1N62_06900 [Nissabacter sp. SGAir0207]
MEEGLLSQLITAGAGILGVILGGAVTYLSSSRIEQARSAREKKAYQAGFLAEVQALVTIIRERGYLEELGQQAERRGLAADALNVKLEMVVPDNYARFYEANLTKVGDIDPALATRLVTFHQLLQAVITDFKPDAYNAERRFSPQALEENYRILKKAMLIGDELVSYLENPRP